MPRFWAALRSKAALRVQAERQIREIRLVAFKAQLPLLQHLWIDVEDVLDGRDATAQEMEQIKLTEKHMQGFIVVGTLFRTTKS
jgi:hypothetical protein